MTRTPADGADLDLALREAAEQWRLDFQVPPMPLLDKTSQPPEVRAPVRVRWRGPALVAASIIAFGAVAAVVVSTARPTNQVAGPSVSGGPAVTAGPAVSAGTSLSSAASVPSGAPTPQQIWPTPVGGELVVQEGTPPPFIRVGGATLPLRWTGAPTDMIIDSDHPQFLSVSGRIDPRPCGSVTQLYLDRATPGTTTVTEAHFNLVPEDGICNLSLTMGGRLQGEASFPVARERLTAGTTGVPLHPLDLSRFPAPGYLPSGYELSPSFAVAEAWTGRGAGSQVTRTLIDAREPHQPEIRLTWQDPGVDSTAAPEPSRPTQVIRCATRVLEADLAVTACGNTIDPQQPAVVAELQRVVDSIPH